MHINIIAYKASPEKTILRILTKLFLKLEFNLYKMEYVKGVDKETKMSVIYED